MTAQDLKNSILQLAVQGKLVSQRKTEASVDLSGLKQKKTNECEFDIPNSWRFAHLETITRGVPSKQCQILESEVKQDGRFPVISQSKAYSIGFTDNEEKLYHHEDPVVIFGDHTTEIKFVDFDFVVGADGVKIFKPITSVITAKFLLYVLQFYSRDLHKVGGYSRHYKFIKNNPIPLPPLAEQERIVAKIEELLPLVSEYDEVENRISALNAEFPDKLRKSILQQAVQGKLTERDPSDEPASELLKHIQMEKSKLIAEGRIKKEKQLPPITEDDCPFEIPNEWEWVRLTDVGEVSRGRSKHRPRNDTILYRDGKYPLIQTGDVARSGGLITSCSASYNDVGLAQSRMWPKGTLCLTIAANIADVGILDFDACFPDSVVGFNAFKPIASNKYFLYMLMAYKAILDSMATRSAQKNINLETIASLAYPLPPLAEQKRIVARVEDLLAACKAL